MAALRTTRNSHGTTLFGAGRYVTIFKNASCTTSSGAAHHWRAYSTSARECLSTSSPRISGPIMDITPAKKVYPTILPEALASVCPNMR